MKLLFIGNSLSASYGGLENLIPAMMQSRSIHAEGTGFYAPGQTLAGHWYNNLGQIDPWRRGELEKFRERERTEAAKAARTWEIEYAEKYRDRKGLLDSVLNDTAWDRVIVQPTVREASEPVLFETYECARLLVQKIKQAQPAAQLVLYVPGRYKNDPDGKATDRLIALRQELMARNPFEVAPPVSEAFEEAIRTAEPVWDIYRNNPKNPHDNHPGYCGGYLIACVIFAGLTKQNPVGLPHKFRLTPTYDLPGGEFRIPDGAVLFLQELAHKHVWD